MMILSGILVLIAISFSAAVSEVCVPVECSSWGYGYATCPVPGATVGASVITRVTIGRKYSKSACVYGSSYAEGQGIIWVNNGCRGRFHACYLTGLKVQCKSVDCSSWGYNFAVCQVPGARLVASVRVDRKYSQSGCDYGHGFGRDVDIIWVNHGCRAKFEVCYTS